MFWIDIPAGLALLVLAVYLIDSLLEKIVDAFVKAAANRSRGGILKLTICMSS